MCALVLTVLLSISQHKKFGMPSFSDYKDLVGAPKFKKHKPHDADHAH